MFEPNLKKCPTCGSKVEKLISFPAFRRDKDWSDENGGRGQWIAQIAENEHDQTAYCRNPAELVEKAKRRGFTKIEKVS